MNLKTRQGQRIREIHLLGLPNMQEECVGAQQGHKSDDGNFIRYFREVIENHDDR